MSIISIFNLLNRIWIIVLLLQLPIVILSNRALGVKTSFFKDFIVQKSSDAIPGYQSYFFIFFYNSILLLIYLFTRISFIITLAIPFGALLLYLSYAGDVIVYTFSTDDSDGQFLGSIELKNIICISILSAIINIIASNHIFKELNNCSELYPL